MRATAFLATGLLVVAAGSGCQTVNPAAVAHLEDGDTGTAPSSYSAGRALQTIPLPPAAVRPAVALALEDLRVEGVRQREQEGAILFEGRTADHRRAAVSLRHHPAGTRLSARFGVFGDEPLTRALLDRVGVRLGTLPPSAIPVDPPSKPAGNPYFSRAAVPDSVMFKDQAEAPYKGTAVP